MPNKKLKISYRNFFHVYGLILVWIGFIVIKLLIPKFPLFLPVLYGLFIGSILSLLIFNKRYLLTLEINDSIININYFRFYFIIKVSQFKIDQIDQIICKTSELVIMLKTDKKKLRYDIPKRKMIEFLNMKVEFSNLINIIEK